MTGTKYSKNKPILSELCKKLQNKPPENFKNIFIGYDGFIDSITHVVDKRIDKNNYTRINTIADIANRIQSVSGLSTNMELVTTHERFGGNGPIMAEALQKQGHHIYYAGALGIPQPHSIYRDFTAKCKQVISFGNSGHTEALEFLDGKLLLGKTQQLDNITWENLIKKCPKSKLSEILKKVSLLSFNNWTMIYGMNDIMKEMAEIIKKQEVKPAIFIDLADPQKRTTNDILSILDILTQYASFTTVLLSMNEKESSTISSVLGCFDKNLATRAKNIGNRLQISHTIIHPVDGAFVYHKEQTSYTAGPYTQTPKLTTGAGDNFNAGYCNGFLLGLSPLECLITGVYTSGFYVRHACAPSSNELINFIEQWI